MADRLVIEGVRPWDGEYPFEIADRPFTQREWRWIKEFSRYLPLTWTDGLAGGDADLIAAFAVIALHRAGKIQPDQARSVFDRFEDVPFGAAIRLELEESAEDGDADPPGSFNGNTSSSGDESKTSSGLSGSPSGIPASDTSVSAPVMSTT